VDTFQIVLLTLCMMWFVALPSWVSHQSLDRLMVSSCLSIFSALISFELNNITKSTHIFISFSVQR
jgi:hypothetical protein